MTFHLALRTRTLVVCGVLGGAFVACGDDTVFATLATMDGGALDSDAATKADASGVTVDARADDAADGSLDGGAGDGAAPYCLLFGSTIDPALLVMCPDSTGTFVGCTPEAGAPSVGCCGANPSAATCQAGPCGPYRACCVDDDCGQGGSCVTNPERGLTQCVWRAACSPSGTLLCPNKSYGAPCAAPATRCSGYSPSTAHCVSPTGPYENTYCCTNADCPQAVCFGAGDGGVGTCHMVPG